MSKTKKIDTVEYRIEQIAKGWGNCSLLYSPTSFEDPWSFNVTRTDVPLKDCTGKCVDDVVTKAWQQYQKWVVNLQMGLFDNEQV